MTHDPHPKDACHISLLADHGDDGRPVFEVLPALRREANVFVLMGSPGLVLGCAAGDVLRVTDNGAFEVSVQGANFCVQVFHEEGFTPAQFAGLEEVVGALGGLAEAPPNLGFAVATIARSVGSASIERVLNAWAADVDGAEWWFANPDDHV